jgi:hypothetical protein
MEGRLAWFGGDESEVAVDWKKKKKKKKKK